MSLADTQLDIARNVRSIEKLKAELLRGMADLSAAMVENEEAGIQTALATILLNSYILARRLGISYHRLDAALDKEIRHAVDQDSEIERWYGDYSRLWDHLRSSRRGLQSE